MISRPTVYSTYMYTYAVFTLICTIYTLAHLLEAVYEVACSFLWSHKTLHTFYIPLLYKKID